MTNKSEAFEKLEECILSVKLKFGKMSAAIRSDNGDEFTGNEIEEILCENDIHHYEIRPSIAR